MNKARILVVALAVFVLFATVSCKDTACTWDNGVVQKAATCTEAGSMLYTCVSCGATKVEEVPALGHSYTVETDDRKASTCAEAGYISMKCERCDSTWKKPVDKLDHDFATLTTKEATCTETGLKETKCIKCGYKNPNIQDVTIPAMGHDFSIKTDVVAPTCTDGGYTIYKCSRCSVTEHRNQEAALNHSYKETSDRQEATCEADGYVVVKCERCDDSQKQTIAKLGHDWDDGMNFTVTCTEDGYTLFKCKRCSKTEKRSVVAHTGHKYVTETTKEATCTETGLKENKCTKCGDVKSSETIKALGHNYSEEVRVVAPTCLEEGYTIYRCSRCDETQNRNEKPALGHSCTVETSDRQEATCEADGYVVMKCVRCDETEKKTLDKLGHDWVEGKAVAVTCTEDGYTLFKCSRCSKTEKRNVVAHTGHKYVTETTKEATCTETGLKETKCENCGEKDPGTPDETIAMIPHSWDDGTSYAATCEADGYILFECTKCGNTKKTVSTDKAKGHSYKETSDRQEATCEADGYVMMKCERCDSTQKKTIAKLGHAWDDGTVVDPKCTTEGYTVYKCSRCSKTENRDVKAATGHKYVTETTKEATCTETGLKETRCTKCGEKDPGTPDETIKALGHDYSKQVSVVAPTCTKDGYTIYKCSRCDETENRDVQRAQGHSYADYIEKAATCTEDGLQISRCSRCHEKEPGSTDKVLDKLGHNFLESNVVAPTCRHEGYTVYKCSRCSATENRDKKDALGHDFSVELSRTEATCEKEGEVVVGCSRCSSATATTTIPAKGHDWQKTSTVVAPTCTTDGYTVYKCSRCSKEENQDIKGALGHDYEDHVETAATCINDGLQIRWCSRCHEKEPGTTDVVLTALGHDYINGDDDNVKCSRSGCGYEQDNARTASDAKTLYELLSDTYDIEVFLTGDISVGNSSSGSAVKYFAVKRIKTIHLNGHAIEGSVARDLFVLNNNYAHLIFTGPGNVSNKGAVISVANDNAGLSIKGGTYSSTDASAIQIGSGSSSVDNGIEVIITDAVVETSAAEAAALTVQYCVAEINVSNSTLRAPKVAVYANSENTTNTESKWTMTFSDDTFICEKGLNLADPNEAVACGIFFSPLNQNSNASSLSLRGACTFTIANGISTFIRGGNTISLGGVTNLDSNYSYSQGITEISAQVYYDGTAVTDVINLPQIGYTESTCTLVVDSKGDIDGMQILVNSYVDGLIKPSMSIGGLLSDSSNTGITYTVQ